MLLFLPTWQHSLLSKSRQDLQGRDTDWHVGQESFLLPFRFQMHHPAQSRVSGWGEDGFSESLHTTLGGLGRGGAWVDRAEVLQLLWQQKDMYTVADIAEGIFIWYSTSASLNFSSCFISTPSLPWMPFLGPAEEVLWVCEGSESLIFRTESHFSAGETWNVVVG